jgi:hypothetical protein
VTGAAISGNSLVSVLVPAVVGALLGFAGALFLRRGEHRWLEARESQQRDWDEQREQSQRDWDERREQNQREWQEARESQQRDWDQQREQSQRDWDEQRELQAREWQAEQQRLAHERDVAWQQQRDWFIAVTQDIPSLDAALVAAQRFVEGRDAPADDRSRWDAAYTEWQEGWVTYSPHLGDDEVERRYQAVGSILMDLKLKDDEEPGMWALVNVAVRAIINARIALAYSRRRDPLPAASFPSSDVLTNLLGQGDPTPYATNAPLKQWLNDHPEPPWRPPATT